MKTLAHITGRRYDLRDVLITGFDQGLAFLFGARAGAVRPSPALEVEQVAELDAAQRRDSAACLRASHAGEVAVQALYRGMYLAARDPELRSSMKLGELEAGDHLAWCEGRIQELGGRTSRLRPFCYLGTLAAATGAGLLGDRWCRGLSAAAGSEAAERLAEQDTRLPGPDSRSRAVIRQLQEDEARHGTPPETDAAPLPAGIRPLVGFASRALALLAARV